MKKDKNEQIEPLLTPSLGLSSSKELNKFRKLRAWVKWESCRRNPEFSKDYEEWKRNYQARMCKLKRKKKLWLPQDIEDPELRNLLEKWAGSPWGIRDPITIPNAEPFPECFYYFKPAQVIDLHNIVKFFVGENRKRQKGENPITYPRKYNELVLQIDITKPIKYLIPDIEREISRAQRRMRQKGIIFYFGQGVRIIPSGMKVPKFEKTKEEFKKMFQVWDWRKNGKTYSHIGGLVFPTDDPDSRTAKVRRYYKHADDLIMKKKYLLF